jgi:hypothetical protein
MSIRREKRTFSFTKPLREGLPPAAPGKRDYYNAIVGARKRLVRHRQLSGHNQTLSPLSWVP